MSFYVLLPLYAAALAAMTRRRRTAPVTTELAILGLLGLASLVANHLFISSGHDNLSRTVAGTFAWFALGMGLAVASAHRDSWANRLCVRLGTLNGTCWLAALVAFGATAYVQSVGIVEPLLYGVAAFFFLLPAVFPRPACSPAARLLGNPLSAWLGLVSYGIYLWHRAAVQELASCLNGVATVPRTVLLFCSSIVAAAGLGAFSYYVVELQFLRRKER
jgi:peptidoglycan/LPS O-acetylase OafA/YrhL